MSDYVVPVAFDFDSVLLKEIPTSIGGVSYVLQEADSEAGAFYEDAMIGSVVMNDGKPVSVSNVKVRDLGLLWRCLYKVEETPKGEKKLRVGMDFVNSLPRHITEPLVKAVKEISGLNDSKETVGNDSSSTEDNSE